jgi:hypothetical protein
MTKCCDDLKSVPLRQVCVEAAISRILTITCGEDEEGEFLEIEQVVRTNIRGKWHNYPVRYQFRIDEVACRVSYEGQLYSIETKDVESLLEILLTLPNVTLPINSEYSWIISHVAIDVKRPILDHLPDQLPVIASRKETFEPDRLIGAFNQAVIELDGAIRQFLREFLK